MVRLKNILFQSKNKKRSFGYAIKYQRALVMFIMNTVGMNLIRYPFTR